MEPKGSIPAAHGNTAPKGRLTDLLAAAKEVVWTLFGCSQTGHILQRLGNKPLNKSYDRDPGHLSDLAADDMYLDNPATKKATKYRLAQMI